MRQLTRAVATATCALLVHPVARGATLPAQGAPADSAVAYLDSVAAIVTRSHWDTAAVGARWQALHRTLRDSLRADPSLDQARRRATQLLQALGSSHFGIIPARLAPPPSGATGDGVAGGDRGGSGGGEVRMTVRVFHPYVLVMDVPPGSGAWNAGLRPGQLIEAVRGMPMAQFLSPIAGMPPRARDTYGPGLLRELLAGDVGSPIRLAVREATGERREFWVPRERPDGELLAFVGLPPQRATFQAWTLVHDGMKLGAIRFSPWLPQLVARIDSAVDRMRGVDAMIVDLRGNPGGAALMASGVAGHFTRDTLTLVTMLARGSTLRYVANPRRVNPALQRVEPFAGPLVLLVDAGTASTSEFFAGGLQAAKRAVVVGDTTAGMALPALTAALPFGDRLMHAIADARLPTGTALDGRGVIPDVVVTIDRRRLAMGQDPEFLVAAIVAASRARMARGPAPTAPPAPPTARPVPPATSRTGPG